MDASKMKLVQRVVLALGVVTALPMLSTEQEKVVITTTKNPLESVFRKNETYSLKVPLENKDVELLVGGGMKVDQGR